MLTASKAVFQRKDVCLSLRGRTRDDAGCTCAVAIVYLYVGNFTQSIRISFRKAGSEGGGLGSLANLKNKQALWIWEPEDWKIFCLSKTQSQCHSGGYCMCRLFRFGQHMWIVDGCVAFVRNPTRSWTKILEFDLEMIKLLVIILGKCKLQSKNGNFHNTVK